MRHGYDHDILFIEGQGSVLHPASTAWLPLIRGSCPTHLILVHRWQQRTLSRLSEVQIPPLQVVAGLYEAVCTAGGAFPAAKVAGIALNCAGLDDDAARAAVAATAAATGLPVADVVRFGAEPLIEALLQRQPDRSVQKPTAGTPQQGTARSQNQTGEAAILRLAALIEHLKAQGTLHEPRVEAALRALPRHLFLSGFPLERVYEDDAIQTKQEGEARSSCSQPTVVAEMLEMLRPQAGETILEIGAGTGWNAALIGNLVGPEGRVVTLDIDEDTVERARENLTRAGVTNVEARCTDGGYGDPAHGPYDAIVATASAATISPHWLEQLKPGGRMVVPLTYNTIEIVVAFRNETTADGAACLVGRDFRHFYFMPLRGAFARARTGTHTPEIQLACEPTFGVEAEAVLHLLRLPSRETALPDLMGEDTGGLIDYLALRGEPLVLVTRSIEGGSEALQGLAEPNSLALMEVWWQDTTRGKAPLRLRTYGPRGAADRVSMLANEWVERNKPGLDQVVFTVAPIGTLPESPESPPVRRHGMEYRADILTKRPEDQ
jgi:methyltransferase of FxLD system